MEALDVLEELVDAARVAAFTDGGLDTVVEALDVPEELAEAARVPALTDEQHALVEAVDVLDQLVEAARVAELPGRLNVLVEALRVLDKLEEAECVAALIDDPGALVQALDPCRTSASVVMRPCVYIKMTSNAAKEPRTLSSTNRAQESVTSIPCFCEIMKSIAAELTGSLS